MSEEVDESERKKLSELQFEECCQSIKDVRGFPGDLSDAEYAQQVRVRDLLEQMVKAGFQKARAKRLIAEGSDTPAHLVSRWTRFVAAHQGN
jgi:hypothetical protein